MSGFSLSGVECPACRAATVDTENATDLEVYDGVVCGWLDWSCPSCGATGTLSFESEHVNATVYMGGRFSYRIRDGMEVTE